MAAAEQLGRATDMVSACRALNVPRASLYRARKPPRNQQPSKKPPRALSEAEEQRVLSTLGAPHFVDKAPASVYAELVDSGTYLCSVRTMYRILTRHKLVRERRNQLRHPKYAPPELLAERPNQLWSWDITKLKGTRPYEYYFLYTMIDVYSRCVVGWLVMERESSDLARLLIAHACNAQSIEPNMLTIHADNGAAMIAKPVAWMLESMGIAKTHSRPHVSNDNPFIESHFKTLKYRPTFPKQFGCMEDARDFLRDFYQWYNHEHRHSGIAYLTPAEVHGGKAKDCLSKRGATLCTAFMAHPERFVKGCPRAPTLPESVWINPPKTKRAEQQETSRPQDQSGPEVFSEKMASRSGKMMH